MSTIRDIELSVIDISKNTLENPVKRKEEIEKLIKSFTEVGFCFITEVEGYNRKELLKWTRWFYDEVPEDIKIQQLATKPYNSKNSNIYRGYFPLIDGQLSHKKGYDIGPIFKEEDVQEGNPFTENTPKFHIDGKEKEIQEFYKVMYKHQKICENYAQTIMSMIAEAGNESLDFFRPLFEHCPMHTFRPLMYPKRLSNIPKAAYLPDGRIISTPAHMDSGFLTLLQTFDYPGLEIEVNNEWFSVPVTKNTLVVNLGEQMTNMSNGRFKSTIHRVIDIKKDRFSLPFFYEPSYSTNINTKIPKQLLPINSEKKYSKTNDILPFGAFLLNKLPIYAEYADICKNLPEWMKKEYLEKFENLSCWAVQRGIKIDGQAHNG